MGIMSGCTYMYDVETGYNKCIDTYMHIHTMPYVL